MYSKGTLLGRLPALASAQCVDTTCHNDSSRWYVTYMLPEQNMYFNHDSSQCTLIAVKSGSLLLSQFWSSLLKWKMSFEATIAIVFGILQVGIGLITLWQQRQAHAQPQRPRRMHPLKSSEFVWLICCRVSNRRRMVVAPNVVQTLRYLGRATSCNSRTLK